MIRQCAIYKLTWLATLPIVLLVAIGQRGQPPVMPEVLSLEPGQTTHLDFTGEKTLRYGIALKRNEMLEIRFEMIGYDPSLKLLNRAGSVVAGVESRGRTEATEVLYFFSPVGGKYELVLTVFATGRCSLHRAASRPKTPSDARRLAIQKLIFDAVTANRLAKMKDYSWSALDLAQKQAVMIGDKSLTESATRKRDYYKHEKRLYARRAVRDTFEPIKGLPPNIRTSIDRLVEARTIFRELGDTEGEIGAMVILSDAYITAGEHAKALEVLDQALTIVTDMQLDDGIAAVLNSIGEAHGKLGDKRKALGFHIRSREIAQKSTDRYARALSAGSVGRAYFELGDSTRAIEHYNEAIAELEKDPDKRYLDKILTLLGNLYLSTGEIERAFIYYDRALQAARLSRDRALLLSYVGAAHALYGERDKALGYYQRALAEAKGYPGIETLILIGQGEFYANAGDPKKALETLERASQLNKEVRDPELEGFILNNTGLVLSSTGQNQQALSSYTRAEQLTRQTGNKGLRAVILLNLGFLYSGLGENDRALEYTTEAYELQKLIGNRRGEAIALNNIGLFHALKGDRQSSLQFYERAASLDQFLAPISLVNLASSNLTPGGSRLALAEYQKALDVSQSTGNRTLEPIARNNVAAAYAMLGQHGRAVEEYNRALELLNASGDRRGQALVLTNLMDAWDRSGSRAIAVFYGKQAVNTLQALRRDIGSVDREVQDTFRRSVEMSYRRLIQILIETERLSEAEQVLRMLKQEEYFTFLNHDGRVVDALDERIGLNPVETRAASTLNSHHTELARLHRDLERLRLDELAARATGTQFAQQRASLRRELDAAATNLAEFLAELVKMFDKAPEAVSNLGDGSQPIVRSWNEPQSALVSTVVGPEKLSLIVTTASSRRGYTVAVTEPELRKLADDFRAAVTDGRTSSDPFPLAQRLYDKLLKPIRADLDARNIRTVVWSLDKFLRYTPISALWDKQKGFVVESYATVVLSLAGPQNIGTATASKENWRALGLGVSRKSGHLGALPNVPAEIAAIVRDETTPAPGPRGLFPGRRLLNEKFTRASFDQSIGRYQLAHAATHFVFVSGTKAEGLGSYLLLGDGSKLTLAQIQNSPDVFANVELLTLSACDTAYGEATADGREIEGLGVLAQRKGARAILATLWPVDDLRTREFMLDFYTRLRQPGVTKSEALHQAQLTLLRHPRAHPYFWAPFILTGNWR